MIDAAYTHTHSVHACSITIVSTHVYTRFHRSAQTMYSDDSEDAFDVFGSDDNVPDQGLNHTVDSSHPSSSLSCSTTLAAALPAAHDTAAHTPSASDSTTRPSRVTHTHDKPRLISTPHSRHASLSPSSSASGTLIHSSTLPSAVAEAAAVGDAHSHTSQACAAGISDNAADRTPITPSRRH